MHSVRAVAENASREAGEVSWGDYEQRACAALGKWGQ
jgi:hypothetical protein